MVLVPELGRAALFALLEIAIEVRHAVEAGLIGDLADGSAFALQQLTSLSDPQVIDVMDGCFSGHFLEEATKSRFIHVGQLRKPGDGDLFTEMVMYE